jgi:hypothetical protein
MRSLASRLGTGAMTLYTHVADLAELDVLLVDAVMAQVEIPEPSADWPDDVELIATAMWRAVICSSRSGRSPRSSRASRRLSSRAHSPPPTSRWRQ